MVSNEYTYGWFDRGSCSMGVNDIGGEQMKLTDYEILDALENGKKIRRNLWWQKMLDRHIVANRQGCLFDNLFGNEVLDTMYITLDDLWARDWEVC